MASRGVLRCAASPPSCVASYPRPEQPLAQHDAQDLLYDLVEWHARVYLEIRDAPEHRLDGLLQGEDSSQLVRMLPIRVIRSGHESLGDHRGWRRQQHDVVELSVELHLVRG